MSSLLTKNEFQPRGRGLTNSGSTKKSSSWMNVDRGIDTVSNVGWCRKENDEPDFLGMKLP